MILSAQQSRGDCARDGFRVCHGYRVGLRLGVGFGEEILEILLLRNIGSQRLDHVVGTGALRRHGQLIITRQQILWNANTGRYLCSQACMFLLSRECSTREYQ